LSPMPRLPVATGRDGRPFCPLAAVRSAPVWSCHSAAPTAALTPWQGRRGVTDVWSKLCHCRSVHTPRPLPLVFVRGPAPGASSESGPGGRTLLGQRPSGFPWNAAGGDPGSSSRGPSSWFAGLSLNGAFEDAWEPGSTTSPRSSAPGARCSFILALLHQM
jgi:hypothetical protein